MIHTMNSYDQAQICYITCTSPVSQYSVCVCACACVCVAGITMPHNEHYTTKEFVVDHDIIDNDIRMVSCTCWNKCPIRTYMLIGVTLTPPLHYQKPTRGYPAKYTANSVVVTSKPVCQVMGVAWLWVCADINQPPRCCKTSRTKLYKVATDLHRAIVEKSSLGKHINQHHLTRYKWVIPHMVCSATLHPTTYMNIIMGHSISNQPTYAPHLSNFGSNVSYMFVFIWADISQG